MIQEVPNSNMSMSFVKWFGAGERRYYELPVLQHITLAHNPSKFIAPIIMVTDYMLHSFLA